MWILSKVSLLYNIHVLYALYWNTDAKVFIKKNCFDTFSQLTENVWMDFPIFLWLYQWQSVVRSHSIFRRLRHPHFTLPQTPHYYLVSSLRNESISFFLSTGSNEKENSSKSEKVSHSGIALLKKLNAFINIFWIKNIPQKY